MGIRYVIWVGVTLAPGLETFEDAANPFFWRIAESPDRAVEEGGLRFEVIRMRGKPIGIGVEVDALAMVTRSKMVREYDLTVSARAEETLARVREIFKQYKVRSVPQIYRHIDPGEE